MTQLTCLEPSTNSLDALAALVVAQDAPVLISGPSAVLVAAALAQRVPIFGVWLEPGPDYPVVLAARDVATLSWLSDLEHVVLDAPNATAHVAALAAMLTNDEITFSNDVAHVVEAYNRPAPSRALTLWYVAGTDLVSPSQRLAHVGTRMDASGTLRDFATSSL